MEDWISVAVLGVVAAVFLAIVIAGIVNKRKGKSSCSCGGCGNCPMSENCHADPSQTDQKPE